MAALEGVDLIIHAGDIGKEDVITGLAQIAPVIAVRGNVDTGDWAQKYPEYADTYAGETGFYVLHRIQDLDIDPLARGYQVVVSGHSHKPGIHDENGVMYLNPGSAGPRRFSLPICLAKVDIDGNNARAKIIDLNV